MSREQIAHGASGNSQEGTACKAIEEAKNEDGGNVFGHCLWNQKDDVGCPRDEVDGSTAVEFTQRAEKHWAQGDAKDKTRQTENRDDARVVEFGFHFRVGRCIYGGCTSTIMAMTLLVSTLCRA